MSTQSLARIGGLLYLGVAVAGGFSEYVRTSNTVSGDAAATAANVAAHATLFRIAFVADLSDFTLFLGVGLILFTILRSVSPPMAVAMLVINAVSVAIQALNMQNHAGALLAAGDPHGAAQVLVFLNLHRIGYLIAQIFFGLYLLPLAYLVYRSGYFPKAIGVIVLAACAGYVGGVAVSFAATGFESSLATVFGLIGGLGELTFVLWLLIRGVETRRGELAWAA